MQSIRTETFDCMIVNHVTYPVQEPIIMKRNKSELKLPPAYLLHVSQIRYQSGSY